MPSILPAVDLTLSLYTHLCTPRGGMKWNLKKNRRWWQINEDVSKLHLSLNVFFSLY